MYINLDGEEDSKQLNALNHKINYLVNEYKINNLIFNVDNLNHNMKNIINKYKYEFSDEICISIKSEKNNI